MSARARFWLQIGGILALASSAITGAATPASAAGRPKCFGAAARDPLHPCTNPSLSVYPTLKGRDRPPSSACKLTKQEPGPVCTFGVRRAKARTSIALLGDSHALHWRGALDVVAHAKRWRGYSLTQPGCFYTAAAASFPEGLRAPCVTWNRGVLRWFADHPEVSTVFVSQADGTYLAPAPGETVLEAKIDGFRRGWGALPKTVKRVIVIRDVPVTGTERFDCIERVLLAGTQPPGPVCTLPRSFAVRWDAAVSTVLRTRTKRFQYVDLTDFFCDAATCFSVIGGVLVYRDVDHMTVAYSTTLGPYLLRAVRALK